MAKPEIGKKFTKTSAERFRALLLEWYDRHARILPWRYTGNQKPDPYRVWLSEIMLQQTTVSAVVPYFSKFTEKWPTVQALAGAKQEDIMTAWAGLGYYSRARNLHKCAGVVAGDLQGKFPDDQNALKKLPGIGDYTSAAILAIAFNKPATVVDGNIERIMARYFAWHTPMPEAKKDLKNLASGLFESFTERPGDLAQALMDLGATVCIPQNPRCDLCPVKQNCEARKLGIAARIPFKSTQKTKPQKFGHVYWVTNNKGQVLLERRPEKGLLGGMTGLPTSEWTLEGDNAAVPAVLAKCEITDFEDNPVSIRHVFTHFDLELTLKTAKLSSSNTSNGYYWVSADDIEKQGFPTLFKKAVKLFVR